ncbi:MAG: XRE family transcriptional regulator [Desulfotomaculaceae bacterium]|nr:XRE family transcriptional regulator [Desulfotomaculaceae bacterium]MDD4766805.1 XRE family transcriptional regulator [Desulfotomaculaceae bacterium]
MSLGARIKRVRINNGLTVRQLAEKVGLSASFLYQLEQEKTSPSFSTLKSIAAALNTSITLLIEDNLPEEWLIVRSNNYKRVVTDNPGMGLKLLTFLGLREKRMQPMVFELAPGAASTDIAGYQDKEHFLYILEGKIEVTLRDAEYVLNKGDAAYFIFDAPEEFRNAGKDKAVGLWIYSPPGTK